MIETKLNGTTPDIAEENIAKLKEIFPDVFCEGKVDFEKLQQVLGNYVEDAKERYNFSWNGKGKALKLAQSPSTGTLLPCKEESKDWDTTENLYIEGDNLEVLKLLQKSYHNKIKMIYIDPPYNTGHDFVYKDNFKDNLQNYLEITGQTDEDGNKLTTNSESNGRYHTDWLNMMYPRLRLARNLLTDDGVIFISIDDNEVANLKKICDEIFGEDNCLGTFVINSTPNARDYGHIGKMHEFALFYGKDASQTSTNMLPEIDKNFKYNDDKGGYNIHPLYNSNEAFNDKNRPNLYYPFYLYLDKPIEGDFYEIGLEKTENSIEIYPPKSLKNNVQFVWRWGKTKSLEFLNKEIVGYKMDDNEYRIVQKMRHSEKIIRSLLLDKEFSSRRGTSEIEEIFQGKCFSFPKPSSLIYNYVKIATNTDSLVLDFFSGSATTAHAVMQLNAEDGGNRKFICVQLPEPCDESSEAFKAGYKNICEIGKERIRRAGEKILNECGVLSVESGVENTNNSTLQTPNSTLDIGFKVFKLNSSNIKKWQPDFDEIEDYISNMENNFVDNRTELDVVYEIMIKYGLDLTYPVEELSCGDTTLYSIGMGMLIICLANNIGADVAKFIVDYKKQNDIEEMRVVFKDGCFGGNDSLKTNIKEILKVAGVEEFITI